MILFNLIIGFHSCTKDKIEEQDPTAGLTKIYEGYATGAAAKVQLYSKETSITTGYTKFFIALYDSVSGNRIDDAHITIAPLMDMGTIKHAAPFENPESEEAVNHLYPCSVTFIMSSMGGTWTFNIQVHNHQNGKTGSLTIPVTVAEPALSRMKSFTAKHDGSKYFISLIEPSKPKVGMNEMEIAIYKKASMMSFPADSSLAVTLTPEMPTMGHGSPNNINPIHTGKGHYKGKVNFTMTGLWRLHLDYMSGTAVADSTQFFDIEF
jgi:hypothetical protein